MGLVCLGRDDKPIRGYVEFFFHVGNTIVKTIQAELDESGSANVPQHENEYPDACVVKPTDGHWSVIVPRPNLNSICHCPPIDLPIAASWWRTLVGRRATCPNAGRGILIGVIDLGFQLDQSLSHVKCVTVEGTQIQPERHPKLSHGYNICKIISERGIRFEREGVAPAADLVLVDVSTDDDCNIIDSEKVGAAIELLVDEYHVDLISISLGAYVDGPDTEFRDVLLKSIRHARSAGALVIAATGNDPAHQPAIPARLAEVVGVGAIGRANLAPPTSLIHVYEETARQKEGAYGILEQQEGQPEEVFHYLDSTFGEELDLVGPGVGILLCYDHDIIAEHSGTSYATPIVVGALACVLARHSSYRGLLGQERADAAREILEPMCVDLRMTRSRQGAGLPMLPGSMLETANSAGQEGN